MALLCISERCQHPPRAATRKCGLFARCQRCATRTPASKSAPKTRTVLPADSIYLNWSRPSVSPSAPKSTARNRSKKWIKVEWEMGRRLINNKHYIVSFFNWKNCQIIFLMEGLGFLINNKQKTRFLYIWILRCFHLNSNIFKDYTEKDILHYLLIKKKNTYCKFYKFNNEISAPNRNKIRAKKIMYFFEHIDSCNSNFMIGF